MATPSAARLSRRWPLERTAPVPAANTQSPAVPQLALPASSDMLLSAKVGPRQPVTLLQPHLSPPVPVPPLAPAPPPSPAASPLALRQGCISCGPATDPLPCCPFSTGLGPLLWRLESWELLRSSLGLGRSTPPVTPCCHCTSLTRCTWGVSRPAPYLALWPCSLRNAPQIPLFSLRLRRPAWTFSGIKGLQAKGTYGPEGSKFVAWAEWLSQFRKTCPLPALFLVENVVMASAFQAKLSHVLQCDCFLVDAADWGVVSHPRL